MSTPPRSLSFWTRYGNTLGPFRGYSAPRTPGRLLLDGIRDTALLFLSSLPLMLVLYVAFLEVFDVFKLRRMVATLFVFGLEWPWDIGVTLSGPLALLVWTLAALLLMVPAIGLLRAATHHSRQMGRELTRRFLGFTWLVIGVAIPASIAFMVSFTALMVVFALVWTLPFGLLLLVTGDRVRRARNLPALVLPACGAAALHALWIAMAWAGLGAAGLKSERVFSVAALESQTLARLAFSTDGKKVVIESGTGAVPTVVDLETGRLTESTVEDIHLSDTGFAGTTSHVLTDGIEITLEGGAIEFRVGSERRLVQGHRPMETKSIALSPDGSLLASCGTDNVVRLWRPRAGTLHKTLWGHSNDVLNVAFSPDGKRLASASKDGTVRLWEHFR
jgi:hypothetical protein